jgi:ubiquitin C-terminal hydrolase
MHPHTGRQLTKGLLKTAYVCIASVWLEGCQSCHQVSINPSPSEKSQASDPGGILNLGNTCYMNAGLQIIAKFYPDTFDGKTDPLAEAGRAIVANIKDDQNPVTSEGAEKFYEALLENEGKGTLTRNTQEDAEQCFTILLQDNSLISSCSAWERMISFNEKKTIRNYGVWKSECCSPAFKIYLPDNEHVTMQACFEYNYGDEDLVGENQYRDPYLGVVDAIRQTRLEINSNSDTPLAVHLVRFIDTNRKNTKNVTGTLALTVPAGIQYGDTSDLRYRLQGFIVHSGGDTIHAGHYMAYIDRSGQWKRYDDACVQKVTQEEVKKAAQQAYLYFYRRFAS